MMGRVRWSHVTITLALIAALAIAAPAIGGPSLKKLVKKEVAKQIGKATGPPGPAGINGLNGANGADGTARAYATVVPDTINDCQDGNGCSFFDAKGVSSVIQQASGIYCVIVPGIRGDSVPAAVTVDFNSTAPPEGNASAMAVSNVVCPASDFTGFQVFTERHGATTDAVQVDNVGFTIVIP